MWIRSQSNKILCDATDIWVDKKQVRCTNGTTEACYYVLGTYENEERAMEILDQIESEVTSCYAYRMPEV